MATPLDVQVHPDVSADDTATLFRFVDGIVADGKRIFAGEVAQRLAVRQARGGIALGGGVLVPHAAVHRLSRARLIYVQLQTPIDMETPDHEPIRDALTLLVRYPPTFSDHVLLERICNPHMTPILVDLLRKGLLTEAAHHLANTE